MPSLSLQTHWVSAQADSQIASNAIAVGPRGFKAALQSLVRFLIEHEVRANVWVKLPKDDAWWTDIWEYGQQAAGCTIYALGKSDCVPEHSSSRHLAASLRAITIEQDSELKREYLCMVVADNFVGGVLAARVPTGTPCPEKRNLKLYSTLNSGTVSAVAQGIKQIVERSIEAQSKAPQKLPLTASATGLEETSPEKALEKTLEEALTATQIADNRRMSNLSDALLASHAMLSQWDRFFPPALSARQDWPLTEAYVSWQMQCQEDLRSQLSICRSAEKSNENTPFKSISTDFLSQAGQELQAPLTTIKTALTLLGSPALKLTQRQRYLEMISNQCDHQKSLIDSIIQLLQLQTEQNVATSPIQLADLIPGIVSTYQPIAEEKGIMLAYTVPPNLSPVSGVESELKEILIHLINNSIQATSQEGRVWVSAAPHNAHFIALTVKDSGSGLSKSDTARLFEAFYRQPATSGQEAGVGLGLTLAQHLVKRIGGSISADSEPDKGTTIELLLPIHRGAAKPSQSNRPERSEALSVGQVSTREHSLVNAQ